MRRCIAALALAFAAIVLALPAQAQNRLAFIVGNDSYQNIDALKKAVNDARAMAQGLQRLGFQVVLGENLKRREFIERFNTFENSVRAGDTVFLFYSGHGVEVDGANYLIPTDAPRVAPQQQSLLKDESISTDNMIQRLKARGPKSQIIVLDACRENPFRQAGGRSVGGARGLAPTQTPGGVFVIYSAGVGEVALDRLSDNDADPNSVFTRSFLPLLTDPAQSLVSVAKETRLRVKSLASTIGMTQSPAYYDEIDGDLFLARTGTAVATSAPIVPEPPRMVVPSPATPPTNLAKGLNEPSRGAEYGYIFANSDRVRLTPDMLHGLTRDQLRLARNEIYARRGRFFRDQQLATYFSRFDWYKPHAWDVPLNPIEQANVNLIASMER
jgi:Caspase domain/YARHG domain